MSHPESWTCKENLSAVNYALNPGVEKTSEVSDYEGIYCLS